MKLVTIFIALFATFNILNAQKITPTDAGSSVGFTIKNFGLKTNGSLTGLSGSIEFNPKQLASSSFNVSVNSATINTSNNSRDKHLKKDEYFDVANFPTINIASSKISESTIAGRFFVVGNITIKGVTKPIQFGFNAKQSNGGYTFDGEFELNRKDFGVGGNSISMSNNLKVKLVIFAK